MKEKLKSRAPKTSKPTSMKNNLETVNYGYLKSGSTKENILVCVIMDCKVILNQPAVIFVVSYIYYKKQDLLYFYKSKRIVNLLGHFKIRL